TASVCQHVVTSVVRSAARTPTRRLGVDDRPDDQAEGGAGQRAPPEGRDQHPEEQPQGGTNRQPGSRPCATHLDTSFPQCSSPTAAAPGSMDLRSGGIGTFAPVCGGGRPASWSVERRRFPTVEGRSHRRLYPGLVPSRRGRRSAPPSRALRDSSKGAFQFRVTAASAEARAKTKWANSSAARLIRSEIIGWRSSSQSSEAAKTAVGATTARRNVNRGRMACSNANEWRGVPAVAPIRTGFPARESGSRTSKKFLKSPL